MIRNTFLVLLICILFVSLSGIEQSPSTSINPFVISSRSTQDMNIRLSLPEYKIENERHDGVSWQRISLDDATYRIEPGTPDLPMLAFTIAIPNTGGVRVEMTGSSSKIISGFMPIPAQEDKWDGNDRSFVINESYYNGRNFFPERIIDHSAPQIMRDLRLVSVQVSPFVWNPITRQLTVHEQMDIQVSYTSEPSINELPQAPSSISELWAKQYEALVLNFDDYRSYVVANTSPRYLVIHGNFVDTTFQTHINNFVFWKRQKGADVDVFSTAVTGTQNSQILSYIRARYDNPNTRPDFIILIGDTVGNFPIPTYIETISSYNGVGDYPYTHLAGGDLLGDCFIGRISAESNTHLGILMNKIFLYERNINLSTADWLNRMLLVGDWTPSGISTFNISKYIKETSLDVNPLYTFVELYGSEPSASLMNSAINQGVAFFNYRGFLGMSGWSPSTSLVNGAKTPHGVFLTCSTNNFGGTATTESFIRLGTLTVPSGGVTAIGMATAGTHTLYNNTLNGGIFSGILTHHMRTMGEALLHSKLYLNQTYGVSQPNGSAFSAHWCSLMGDPTLDVWIGIPTAMQMDVLANVPLGYALLDVYVTDIEELNVEGACVTLSQGTNILARGWTDEEGHVILALPGTEVAGVAVVTVSKHDHKPLQQTINFDNSGTLVPGTIVIDDDNIGNSSGNNNGLVDAGETVQINFALRNTSTTPKAGISGILTCNSPYLTIISGNVSYPTIAAGVQANSTNPVLLQISPNIPDAYTLRLHLILTDAAGNAYDISEFVPVQNARLGFVSYQVFGSRDVLNPGDNADLGIRILNNGSSAVDGIYGELISNNPLLSVTQSIAYYGFFPTGSQLINTSSFQVFARSLLVPGMVIPMLVRLYNDNDFEQTVHFSITIGTVTVNDPLGPDAYGYLIYDDQDSDYDECPTYNWVGIAPHENGRGIHLSQINDIYNSSNEGDQVGYVFLEVVNLPFAFRMYGESYSQITVCSNGFIALGVTENAEFRNFRLPGAMGPSPMIAGFWDDLAIGTGSGIYWWHNRANNTVIVQWDQMRSGFNGTSIITFQIILYDPTHHATPTGDGPIKIQYKTFNNVNMSSGNRHGNFCTIGIQNNDQTLGLEYTFNNTYPTASSPLGHERALWITTVPVIAQTANIAVDQVYVFDDNANQLLEPGERVNLSIKLSNNGFNSAVGVTAVLSTTDQYVTILNNSAIYGTIQGLDSAFGSAFFGVSISSSCPHNRVVSFTLTISSNLTTWVRSFNLTVYKPALGFYSWSWDDFALNNNGRIDPGESGKIQINVHNESLMRAEGVQITLSESSPHISFTNPTLSCGSIAGQTIYQAATQMLVSPSTPMGTTIPVTVSITSSNAEPRSSQFDVTIGPFSYYRDFEANNGGFTTTNNPPPGWEWGTSSYSGAFSGTRVWGTVLNASYANNAEYQLLSPQVIVSSQSQLKFRHRYNIENSYDGGQVHISSNSGSSWITLTPQGGYPNQNIAVFGNQPGYSGQITTWQEVTFDLSSYANQSVVFRWFFKTDGSVVREGWFIDEVQVTHASSLPYDIAKLSGLVTSYPAHPAIDPLVVIGNYTVKPAINGTFEVLLPSGDYEVKGEFPGYRSNILNLTIASQSIYPNNNLLMQYMFKPEALTWAITGNTINLRWDPLDDPDIVAYRVHRKHGTSNWQTVATILSNEITLTLLDFGVYDFRISALYTDNWASLPTDKIHFEYPFNGIDVQPLNPQNLSIIVDNGSCLLNWDPVSQDIDGNPITVWAYRVYVGSTPDFVTNAQTYLGTTRDLTYIVSMDEVHRFFKVVAIIGFIDH